MEMGTQFTNEDLRAVLNRSMRSTVIVTLIGSPVVWKAWGWQSVLLFLVGAAISATGIFEWRQLVSAIMLRLDAQQRGKGHALPLWRVLFWFFLRLILAGGLLYVSLKVLNGKVLALVAGLALAILVLLVEAFRLFRSWST
jgi:hypothetical protein